MGFGDVKGFLWRFWLGDETDPGIRFWLLAKTDVDGNLKISDSKKRLIFYMLYYAYKKLVAFCSLFFC